MRAAVVAVISIAALVAGERDALPCTPSSASIRGRILIPEDGATQVPTNARVLVEFDGQAVSPDAEPEIRTGDGARVVASVQEARSVRWRTFVLTPREELAPETTYEIWDSAIVPCSPEEWERPACRGPMLRVGTFTTGSSPDVVTPTIEAIGVTSVFDDPGDESTCDWDGPQVIDTITVENVSDDGPRQWVRFYYRDADGILVAGPHPIGRVGRDCGSPYHTFYDVAVPTDRFTVVAVDIAGNVEAMPIEVDGMSCKEGAGADEGGCASGRPLDAPVTLLLTLLSLDVVRRTRRRARTA